MTAEFNLWLLLVGLVAGAGLTWLVIGELRRSDADIEETERDLESAWIADQLAGTSDAVDEEQAAAVLRLHSRYLATSLPPDDEAVTEDAGPAAPEPGDPGPQAADPKRPESVSAERPRSRRRARSSG
jgi:hypothetical protein